MNVYTVIFIHITISDLWHSNQYDLTSQSNHYEKIESV